MADIELLPLPEWAIHPKHVTVEIYPSQLHAGLKAYARVNVKHHTAGLRYEVKTLRDLCAAAYQLAGVHDAPVEWLDALSNAANGKPFSTVGLLPYMPKAVCDAEARAERLEADRDATVLGHQLRSTAMVPNTAMGAKLREIGQRAIEIIREARND